MFRKIFCEIKIVLFVMCVGEILSVIDANPQLDLPPINSKKNTLNANVNGKPKVLPNSYAVKIIGSEEDDDDTNDEHDGNGNDVEPNGRGISSDYDRDRSLRYGPPYIDDTNRQFYRPNNNNNNNNNYYDGNYYNRSTNNDYAYRQRYSYNNDDDRYYTNRNRNNEDDDKYYAQRDRDRFNNPNHHYYNKGDGRGDDGQYYADRNVPHDPHYHQHEYDRNRYGGNGYPYTNNQNGYGHRPYDQNNNFVPPGERFPDGNVFEHDEQARIEQERRYRIEEANLKRILADVNEKSAIECSLNVGAQWNFETNTNEVTQQAAVSSKQKKNNCMNHQV